MVKTLWVTLFCVLILGTIAQKTQVAQQQEGTKVIFYIEHQIQQPQDYVQISIEIGSQQPSLQQAINQAKQIVNNVQQIVNKYCQANAKNKKDCENVVQTSQYQIDPIYQLVRKVPTFVAFSVTYQTTARVKDVKYIGKLADDILKSGVSKINSFEWKPLEQVDSEQVAVTQGMQLVNNICGKMGQTLNRIVAVQQVTDYQGQQEQQQAAEGQQQQGGEDEEKQQQEQNIVYRFEIICQDKAKKNKK